MARPKGTTKEDSLVFTKVTLGLSKETQEWYENIPKRTKSKMLRDAIALYRIHNP